MINENWNGETTNFFWKFYDTNINLNEKSETIDESFLNNRNFM